MADNDKILHDIDSLFDLLRKSEQTQNNRHTEVCSRLTRIETAMPVQPCVDERQLRKEFDTHIYEHIRNQNDWKATAMRIVAAIIIMSVGAFATYAAIGLKKSIADYQEK